MKVSLLTAAMVAVQQCNAAAITKTFLDWTEIFDADQNSLGKIKGETSWQRLNYGKDATLITQLTLIGQRTTQQDLASWTAPEFQIVMSENETSLESEFTKRKFDSDQITTGNTSANASTTIYEVGSAWPTLPAAVTRQTTEADGFWGLSLLFSGSTTQENGTITTRSVFTRYSTNNGVANVCSGCSVTAQLAFSLNGRIVDTAET